MKLRNLALAALPIVFALACSKPADQPENASTDSQKMKAHLTSVYGFQPSAIVETADAFIVEGDTRFPKTNFWEEYGTASNEHEITVPGLHAHGEVDDRKHYRSNYKINNYTWPVIKVNVDNTVPQVWRNAIIDAVDEWNDAWGYLDFQVTYFNYSVNGSVNVKMSNLDNSDLVVATCAYPNAYGKPGSPMHIRTGNDNMTHAKKVFAMVHEIGHAIGLRHTDQGQGTLISGVSSSCKNYSDWSSVMQPTVSPWAGFTNCDLEAYYALYPE